MARRDQNGGTTQGEPTMADRSVGLPAATFSAYRPPAGRLAGLHWLATMLSPSDARNTCSVSLDYIVSCSDWIVPHEGASILAATDRHIASGRGKQHIGVRGEPLTLPQPAAKQNLRSTFRTRKLVLCDLRDVGGDSRRQKSSSALSMERCWTVARISTRILIQVRRGQG